MQTEKIAKDANYFRENEQRLFGYHQDAGAKKEVQKGRCHEMDAEKYAGHPGLMKDSRGAPLVHPAFILVFEGAPCGGAAMKVPVKKKIP